MSKEQEWRKAVDLYCREGDAANLKTIRDCFLSDGTASANVFNNTAERLAVKFKLQSSDQTLSLLEFIIKRSKDVRTAKLIGGLCNKNGANFDLQQIERDVQKRLIKQNFATIERAVIQTQKNTDKVREMQGRVRDLSTKDKSLNQAETIELQDLQSRLAKVSAIANGQGARRTAASITNPPASTSVAPERINPPRVGFFRAAWNRFTSFFTRRSAGAIPAVSNTTPQYQDNVRNSNQAPVVRAISNVLRNRNRVAPAPTDFNTTPQDNGGDLDSVSISPSEELALLLKENAQFVSAGDMSDDEKDAELQPTQKEVMSKEELRKLLEQAARAEAELAVEQKRTIQSMQRIGLMGQGLARPINRKGDPTNQELEDELNDMIEKGSSGDKTPPASAKTKRFTTEFPESLGSKGQDHDTSK